MAPNEAVIERLARRAYERGRAGWALRRACLVPLLGVIAVPVCRHVGPTVACLALLAGAVGVFLWRGREHARGVRHGLLAGAAPLALPFVAQAGGHPCTASICLLLPSVCVAAGAVGGVVLGLRGSRGLQARPGYWLAAVSVTLLVGGVGCLLAGLPGLGGMALGLVLGAAPVMVVRAT